MNEEISILLYESTDRPATVKLGGHTPSDEVRGWDFAVGDTLWLSNVDGGYQQGTIEAVDPETFTDDDGDRYKVAYLVLED